jgi:hypothetical protein
MYRGVSNTVWLCQTTKVPFREYLHCLCDAAQLLDQGLPGIMRDAPRHVVTIAYTICKLHCYIVVSMVWASCYSGIHHGQIKAHYECILSPTTALHQVRPRLAALEYYKRAGIHSHRTAADSHNRVAAAAAEPFEDESGTS